MWGFQDLQNRIFKQYKTTSKIGAIRDLLDRSLFYVAVLNFALVALTAYNTTLRPYLEWISLPLFIGIIGLLVGGVTLLEYKFVYPAIMAFRNQQEYLHQSKLREDLIRIEAKLDTLLEAKKEPKND